MQSCEGRSRQQSTEPDRVAVVAQYHEEDHKDEQAERTQRDIAPSNDHASGDQALAFLLSSGRGDISTSGWGQGESDDGGDERADEERADRGHEDGDRVPLGLLGALVRTRDG